tara:strand:- start:1599 stop:2003 length:405 start_codon:yes stop_codon:yes gene_type:complete
MRSHFNPKNNPRVIIIQKLYSNFFNDENDLDFPKHRFKKFIKDIVNGTIERNDLILDELNKKLGKDFTFEKLDKILQTILKAATYEFMYKPNLSINIIIKEYLNSSNFFLEDSQTKYLNALLDNLGKKLRSNNA